MFARPFLMETKLILHNVFMVFVSCLVYGIGYYHRNCTGVLLTEMASSLHVSESKLGILSTMFFWSYAIVQPFIGSLSDIFESSYIVSIALLSSSIFTFICGISRNYYLTCTSRFFVGISCGSMYVPVCRTMAQWFSPKAFPYAQSLIVAFGGLGGLLAQMPIGSAKGTTNWPIVFYVGSGISLFLAIPSFFLLKDPKKEGKTKVSAKFAFSKLIQNVKLSSSLKDFWFLAIWKFLTPSTYSNVSSTWGKSYLLHGLGYDKKKASSYISITSFAWTVGSPFLALVSNWTHTRKWCLLVCTIIAFGATIFFAVLNHSQSNALIISMLFVFALTSGASLTIAAITFKEMLSKELVGTLMGCGNFFMLIGTSIEQTLTACFVNKYENKETGVIPLIAYRYGLWTLSAVSICLSIPLLLLLKDTYYKALIEGEQIDDTIQNSTPLIPGNEQKYVI